jgi:hydroxymethylbilane synthase
MKNKIRVGSRESRLAMIQTEWVINKIKSKFPEIEFEITAIKTKGDILLDTRLDKLGGKGLFIKELENALLNNDIDFAVHSMKDIPAEIPNELTIAAFSKREDPRDVLISRDGSKLEDLKYGAVIGTSSVRREVQLSKIRQDLKFKTLRGNVLTRLDKSARGEYDAIVLAAAGLNRLGLGDKITQYFSIDDMIPAVCQGVIGIEMRRDSDIACILEDINCNESAICCRAERGFMIRLCGGCSTPMAAHAVIDGDKIKVLGMLALEDRSKVYRHFVEGDCCDAEELGVKLAYLILQQIK